MKDLLQTQLSPPESGRFLPKQQSYWKSPKAPCTQALNKCAAAIAQVMFQQRYRIMSKAVACRLPVNTPGTASGRKCMKDRRYQTSVSQEAVCVCARG